MEENIKDKLKYEFWKVNYSDEMTWEEFDDDFAFCNMCKQYSERQCICYTRN